MGKNWLQDLAKIKTTFVKEYISEADCIILVFKEPFHYKDNVKHNNWYYEVRYSLIIMLSYFLSFTEFYPKKIGPTNLFDCLIFKIRANYLAIIGDYL